MQMASLPFIQKRPVQSFADTFLRDGYVSNFPIFTVEEVAEIRNYIFTNAQKNFNLDPGQFPPQLTNLCWDHEFLWKKAVANPKLLDLVEAIFGTPNLMHLSSALFTKYGSGNSERGKRPKVHVPCYFVVDNIFTVARWQSKNVNTA